MAQDWGQAGGPSVAAWSRAAFLQRAALVHSEAVVGREEPASLLARETGQATLDVPARAKSLLLGRPFGSRGANASFPQSFQHGSAK